MLLIGEWGRGLGRAARPAWTGPCSGAAAGRMPWLGPSAEAGLSTAVSARHDVREFADISHQRVLPPYPGHGKDGPPSHDGWFAMAKHRRLSAARRRPAGVIAGYCRCSTGAAGLPRQRHSEPLSLAAQYDNPAPAHSTRCRDLTRSKAAPSTSSTRCLRWCASRWPASAKWRRPRSAGRWTTRRGDLVGGIAGPAGEAAGHHRVTGDAVVPALPTATGVLQPAPGRSGRRRRRAGRGHGHRVSSWPG
jgi:hypothetical protein